jgi:hypothetical protein
VTELLQGWKSVSPRRERALQKLLIWVEASTSEEALAGFATADTLGPWLNVIGDCFALRGGSLAESV